MTHARRATAGDVPELIRLRKIMHASMSSKGLEDPAWQNRAQAMLLRELARPESDLAAFVVDGPHGALNSCATGLLQRKIPSPRNPIGLSGYVFNVATDPKARRRGYSRVCMRALLDWFRERGAERIELRASDSGEPLYRSLGFEPTRDPSMRLSLQRVDAAEA